MGFWSRGKKKKAKASASTQNALAKPGKSKRRHAAVDVKVLAAEARLAGLTAQDVSALVGFSTASVESWTRSYKEGGPRALCKQARGAGGRRLYKEIEERIEAHRREHPEHGVRRIRDELKRDEGLEVSAETVRRVVNDAGLGQGPPVSKRRPPQVRRFERSFPNAMWQIDIMTFQLKRLYPVFLVGMIDDHSRYIVGHGLFRQQTVEAVLEVVKGALGQWGAPREILSDNGRQFVAWRGKTRFQKVLKQQGVQHVRSAPHHPMTLGKIERFWRTIWEEFLCEAVFASFGDACQRIEHWVGYYNHQRVHQGIGGACPADRFYGLAGDMDEAVRQGCKDNSLRLALGQEPQPPLYLMGKLGGADVRVQRQAEGIEVKVGDAVHEVIQLGAPYVMGQGGCSRRGERDDEMERSRRPGALPGSDDADTGRGDGCGAKPDFQRQSPEHQSGTRAGGAGVAGCAGAQGAGSQGQERGAAADRGPAAAAGSAAPGASPGEEEGGDSPGVFGPGEDPGTWRSTGADGEKKRTGTNAVGVLTGARRSLREARVALGLQQGWPDRVMAMLLGMSKRALTRWVHRRQQTEPSPPRQGRPPVIGPLAREEIRRRYLDSHRVWGPQVLAAWATRQGLGSYSPTTVGEVIKDLKLPEPPRPKPKRYEVSAANVIWIVLMGLYGTTLIRINILWILPIILLWYRNQRSTTRLS